jgi:hypothetical protein
MAGNRCPRRSEPTAMAAELLSCALTIERAFGRIREKVGKELA